MDFTKMDTGTVMQGVTPDGTRYLLLFMQEYKKHFSETVNPGCPKCITTYLNKYKNKIMAKKENTSGYKLHAKYQNIPLEFGSPILVNNSNITEEYAKKLLAKPDGQKYFAEVPAEKNEKPVKPKKKKAEAPKEPELIELTLTEDDLKRHPELLESDKQVGDIVLVNKAAFEADGTIEVVE